MPPLRLITMLALLTAATAAAQPVRREAPPEVSITVWSYGFAPQPIRLTAGKPVTLTFVNRSGSGHDFTAREFFEAATYLAGSDRVSGGKVDLKPHQTRKVSLVPRAGTYPVHCGRFLHKQMGMRETIVVE